MRRWIAAAGIAIALLAASYPSLPAARAQEPATVVILYDLGDGAYYWSTVTIPDPLAENASWRATQEGAGLHGLTVESSWSPLFGIAVHEIGERWPTSGYAALFEWDGPTRTWVLSNSGISDLVLQNGDVIAWSNAGFDSVDFGLREPVANPSYPYPSIQFRNDGVSGGIIGTDRVGTGTTAGEAPNSASVLWDRDLGVREIVSTPAVAYGMLYVLTFDGLFALDDFTGVVRWTNPRVAGFSSPAVFDGMVIAGSSDGRVYAVDAFDGSEVWNTSLLANPGFSGITSSPRISMDWAFVGTFNESGGPGEVVALWASNGTVAWRHPTGSIHFSSPAVIRGRVYVGVMGRYNTTTQITFDPPHGVLALSRENGTEEWFFPTAGPVAASPVASGSVIYVPSQDGNLYTIWMSNGTERRRADVGAGISSVAEIGGSPFSSSPHALFVGGGRFGEGGGVTALDARDASVLWSFATDGPVQSSVVYADGKVFFSENSAQGTVYALNATAGNLVWSYRPAPADYILATPVVSNGTLYAPSDNGHVYAFRDTSGPLASLESSEGLAVPSGANASLEFIVRVNGGAIGGGRLNVTVPIGFTVTGGAPAPTRVVGRSAEWDLGRVSPPANLSFVVSFLAPSVTVDTPYAVSARLSYTDNDGVSFPEETAEVPVRVIGNLFVPLAIGAGILAIFVAAVVVLLILRRRRRRENP